MAKFHGKTNLHLGEPVWAGSEYDPDSRDYVIDVSGDALEKFRAVAADYGFTEDEGSEPEVVAVAEKPAATKSQK